MSSWEEKTFVGNSFHISPPFFFSSFFFGGSAVQPVARINEKLLVLYKTVCTWADVGLISLSFPHHFLLSVLNWVKYLQWNLKVCSLWEIKTSPAPQTGLGCSTWSLGCCWNNPPGGDSSHPETERVLCPSAKHVRMHRALSSVSILRLSEFRVHLQSMSVCTGLSLLFPAVNKVCPP